MIIKEYYEPPQAYKFDNLFEVVQFLEIQKLSQLSQGKMDKVNSPIMYANKKIT